VETSQYLNPLLYLFGQEEVGQLLASEFEALRSEGVRSQRLEILTGRVYMLRERYAEAEPALLRALELGDNKWPHFYLGLVYDELDRFRDAEKHLKACLALDPNDPEIMNNLGYIYAVQDTKLDEAERLLSQALELEPNNGFYLDSLGWVHYRKGEPDKAIEYIRRALSALERDDAILRDHLGDAYLLKGETVRALGEWKRARRLDPKLEGVQEKIGKYTEKVQKREEERRGSPEPASGPRRRISSDLPQDPR
jgi:Flp pilus assembly protein TadD